MQLFDTLSAIRPHLKRGMPIARRTLPILGGAILLYWLSGGLPPTIWRTLLQVSSQFSTLRAEQGMAALYALLILIVQSILLALAWGILLWLAVREGRVLLSPKMATQFLSVPPAISPSTTTKKLMKPGTEDLISSPRGRLLALSEPEKQLDFPLQDKHFLSNKPEKQDDFPPIQTDNASPSPTNSGRWWIREEEPQGSRETNTNNESLPKPEPMNYDKPRNTFAWSQFLTLLGCVAVGAILFWLSRGLLPSVWNLLQLAISHFSILQKQQGAGAMFTILLLVLRLLCILAGWGILLWFTGHEGRAFFASLPTISHAIQLPGIGRLSSPPDRAPVSTPRLDKPSSSPSPIQQDSSARANILWQTFLLGEDTMDSLLEASGQESAFPRIPLSEENMMRNPFEESGSFPALPHAPLFEDDSDEDVIPLTEEELAANLFVELELNHEKAPHILRLTDFPPAEQKALSSQASDVHEVLEQVHQQKSRPSSDVNIVEPAYPHLSAILHTFHYFGSQPEAQPPVIEEPIFTPTQSTASSKKPASGLVKRIRNSRKLPSDMDNKASLSSPLPSQDSSPAQDNPFDVQSDIANLFDAGQPLIQQSSPESTTGQKTAAAMPPENSSQQSAPDEAKQLFIYGNPFDGELPEVFYHDEVLKRELRAQLGEQHEPNSSGNRRPQKND